VTVPNAARMYDYLLGGYHNFAVDREYAEQVEQALPGARQGAYANRAFVGRVVRWLAGVGIRQFLDIGSGIPTAGNVHEIAEQAAPGVRVMYVDIDPVAVAHTRAILANYPRCGVLQADLRHPADIINHPDVNRVLDFSEPVAVLLTTVLYYISDADNPFRIVGQLRDAVVAGSYIALTHGIHMAELAEGQESVRRLLQRSPTSLHLRTREQVERLLAGLDVVAPGIVPVADWHPELSGGESEPWPSLLAAVGRKP